MAISSTAKEFRLLKQHLDALEQKFLSIHLADPTATPVQFELDVKAYCVLAHASLEEYVEELCRRVMQAGIDGWNNKKVNRVTTSLIGFFGKKAPIEKAKGLDVSRCFDRTRKLLDELKTQYSNEIRGNHGIDIDYLRHLLYPIGIDFGDDPNQLNSLRQLASGRGDFAHLRQAKKIMQPGDAINYVKDVVALWRIITAQALGHCNELS